jgi:hypothetical protein
VVAVYTVLLLLLSCWPGVSSVMIVRKLIVIVLLLVIVGGEKNLLTVLYSCVPTNISSALLLEFEHCLVQCYTKSALKQLQGVQVNLNNFFV